MVNISGLRETLQNLVAECSGLQRGFEGFLTSMDQEVVALETEQAAFQRERALVENISATQAVSVTLDVGGTLFRTTTDTLRAEPGSLLDILCSGRFPTEREPDGSLFLDRDPTHFGEILSYLREPESLIVPKDPTHRKALHREARFYCMDKLVQQLVEPTVERVMAFSQFDQQRYTCSEGGAILTKSSHTGPRAALCDVQMTCGRHQWQVYTTTPFLAVGIVNTCDYRELLPGSDKSSWVFFGTTQEVWHNSRCDHYGRRLTPGDVVSIDLDFESEQGCLTFGVNGESLGVAFRGLSDVGPFYAAVYVYSKVGCSCKVLNYHFTAPRTPSQNDHHGHLEMTAS